MIGKTPRMLRIDRVIRPAGLLRRAWMYSLIFERGVLFAIHTGNAATALFLYNEGGRYAPAAKITQQLYDEAIANVEQRITPERLEELSRTKGSMQIPHRNDFTLSLKGKPEDAQKITLTANGKTYRFVLPRSRREEAAAFIAAATNTSATNPS